jgi:hypothetical protein
MAGGKLLETTTGRGDFPPSLSFIETKMGELKRLALALRA